MIVSRSATSAKRQKLLAPNFVCTPAKTRRRATWTTWALTSATAGSGVVRPCSREMPLAPTNARSSTNPASIRVAQWSTVASVRPRTRPPSSSTVQDGAVATPDRAVLLQQSQVPPDRFRRHRQVRGELRDVDAAVAARQRQDPMLTLLRPHIAPPARAPLVTTALVPAALVTNV